MRPLEVIVLLPDFTPLGPINRMTALRWTERFCAFGDFELWCPLTPENAGFLVQENLIWIGTESVGVIEGVQKTKDEEGALGLHIFGRFNECWLERRIIWDRYSGTDYASNHMRSMVYDNAVNPSSDVRRIPNMVLSSSQTVMGASVAYQANRSNLWDSLLELGKVHRLNPKLINSIPSKVCQFTVVESTDRSVEQSIVPAVVISSDLNDVLSSDYTSDLTSVRSMAIVAGAGEGPSRKMTYLNDTSSGLYRRELYVDARDLSDTEEWHSKITTEVKLISTIQASSGEVVYITRTTVTKVLTHPDTGETRTSSESYGGVLTSPPQTGTTTETGTEEIPIADSIYAEMLSTRGKAKLSEHTKVEAFNSQIRTTGIRAYTYGEDYFLGDRITVEDRELQVQVSTEITEVEHTWDSEGYSVILTLGTSAPTITQLVKRS